MILCTGNPSDPVIASAVKRQWSSAVCVSRTSGFDLSLPGVEHKLRQLAVECDVFVNSSFVAPGVQLRLLNWIQQWWTEADIKGHIISIGTTLENHSDYYQIYAKSKLELRLRSLELNKLTGITGVKTSYLVLGGVNDGRVDNSEYVPHTNIVDIISWILQYPGRIPLIQVEGSK